MPVAGADVAEPEPGKADQVAIAGDRAVRDPTVKGRGQARQLKIDIILPGPQNRREGRGGVGGSPQHEPVFEAEEEPAVPASTMAVAVGEPRGVGRGDLPDCCPFQRDVPVRVLPEPLPAFLNPRLQAAAWGRGWPRNAPA